MDDVVRVAVKKGYSQLPRHLPDLLLGEVLALLFLLVDQVLHVAQFGILHGDVEADALWPWRILRHRSLHLTLDLFGRIW